MTKFREKSTDQPQTASRFRRVPALAALVLPLLLFAPLAVFAKTLDEYRTNLESAGAMVAELIDYVEENQADGAARDDQYEREMLAGIRRELPVSEKIEWEGAALETGNQWIGDKLKAFEAEKSDWAKRKMILAEVGERLSALETRVGELFEAEAAARSKDEDKRKLAEILRREEYQKPGAAQESWFDAMLRKIREWFGQKFPQADIPRAPSGFQSASFFLQMILYAVVLGIIGFLLYRFAPFLARKFRGREKRGREERVILGERLAADETAQSLFSEAEAMAREGDLRGAIRKGYIALLCELSDRRLIGLARHKTNRDYLRDVRKQGELHRDMNGLTVNYERHWYGFEEADQADWDEFKRNYRKAVGEVR